MDVASFRNEGKEVDRVTQRGTKVVLLVMEKGRMLKLIMDKLMLLN